MSRALLPHRAIVRLKLTRPPSTRLSSTASAAGLAGINLNEKTFRAFSLEDGLNYLKFRRGYHPKFYETVLKEHTSTGGKLNRLVDVGTGPGIVVRALAPHFDEATGLDQSEGMLRAARATEASAKTVTRAGKPIRFAFSPAEELGCGIDPPVADGSVDLVTSASAVHWFDMQRFWRSAARVLRPGGSVALWVGRNVVDSATPNAAAIQATYDEMEAGPLYNHIEPGNRLANELYKDLLLPWMVPEPVVEFEEAKFVRKIWTTEGESANAEADELLMGTRSMSLDAVEMILGTTAPVVSWRKANPGMTGEKDVVRVARRKLESILRDAGVKEGEEKVTTGYRAVLLLAKRN